MKAKEVRDALRKEHTEDMDRRRKFMLLSGLGMIDFTVIAMLQSGVVKRLPDIPYKKIFDTNYVNTSETSFKMGVPDAVVSNMLFAAKMIWATAGGSEKASRKPAFDLITGALSVGHALGAARLTHNMFFKKKKICIYCLAGAGLIFASLGVVAPTVLKSAKKMIQNNS